MQSFTATIVAKTLAQYFPELGESALDTPIRQLLPYLNFTMSDRFVNYDYSLRTHNRLMCFFIPKCMHES